MLFNRVVGSSFYDTILENYVGLKVRWTKLWRQRQKDLNLHFPAIKVGPFKKNNTVRKKIVKLKLAQRVFVSLKGLISSEGNLEL